MISSTWLLTALALAAPLPTGLAPALPGAAPASLETHPAVVHTALATDVEVLSYTVDLNHRDDDLFRVTLDVDGLGEDNSVYQFAATAPGTYQVADMGRFVRSFEATDAGGRALEVERVGTNQWLVHDVDRARRIRYTIAETWDTPVDRDPIYMMCGTSIEEDHVLLNPHAVIGYPTGLQDTPIRVRIQRPADWTVGTALETDETGAFWAADYDELVDSPLLMGEITAAGMDVGGASVQVFSYSKTGLVKADDLLSAMRDMLQSAGSFLGEMPVDRYAFLFHFENVTKGAWEHSYSSEYVYAEEPYSPDLGRRITDTAAHEFFHIVTPLNIHSEIIENFNFVTPVPSQHLWLYEGTTEWASDAMQLRSGLKDLDAYLGGIVQKMRYDALYDSSLSLKDLALESYTAEGQVQYGNIYMRGALVAGLLDIRLLELSHGERGLIDVVMELSQRFGKSRAFPEDGLYDIITEMTYPEIGDFFGSYVQAANPLPIREYYAKLGLRLIENEKGEPVRFELDPDATPQMLALRQAWMRMRPTA